MIKISERSFTLHFDDSMSSFSSEKKIKLTTGLSDLRNVIHKEEKAMLEDTIRLHTRKTFYLNLSPSHA